LEKFQADNILFNFQDDAWVIEFGSGRTEGWVASGKAATVKEDLQGLRRILELIASSGYD